MQAIRTREAAPGVRIHATGNPVLVGWVDSYSAQILQIFLYTVFIVLAILIVYTRRLYGILLPLLGMALTSIWGVGFMGVLGYNLDPLMLVVPFDSWLQTHPLDRRGGARHAGKAQHHHHP